MIPMIMKLFPKERKSIKPLFISVISGNCISISEPLSIFKDNS